MTEPANPAKVRESIDELRKVIRQHLSPDTLTGLRASFDQVDVVARGAGLNEGQRAILAVYISLPASTPAEALYRQMTGMVDPRVMVALLFEVLADAES